MWRRREIAALFAAVMLLSCTDAPPATTTPAPETASPETSLVAYAAGDFRLHVARDGAEFRNVHLGEMRGENGVRSVLCGEFRHPGQADWAPFATIRTDPYENWIGGTALPFCTGANATLDQSRDLSASLTERYRAQQ